MNKTLRRLYAFAAAVMLALYCAVAAAAAGKTGSLTVLLSDGDGAAVPDILIRLYRVGEPDGTLTVILKQPQQPVTAEMLGITPKDTGLPLVVVSDGKMVPRSLELLHLSPADIERRLKNQSIAVEDVFLMTLDDCGNTFLQKKEGRV